MLCLFRTRSVFKICHSIPLSTTMVITASYRTSNEALPDTCSNKGGFWSLRLPGRNDLIYLQPPRRSTDCIVHEYHPGHLSAWKRLIRFYSFYSIIDLVPYIPMMLSILYSHANQRRGRLWSSSPSPSWSREWDCTPTRSDDPLARAEKPDSSVPEVELSLCPYSESSFVSSVASEQSMSHL